MVVVTMLSPAGLEVQHAGEHCPVCQQLGSHAMALLIGPAQRLPAWEQVLERLRDSIPRHDLGGHVDNVQDALVVAYEDIIERCLSLTDAALRSSESWESALFYGLLAAIRETLRWPGAVDLHYFATTADLTGRLLAVRNAYTLRLVEQYTQVRDDSPPRLAVEMAIGMTYHALRARAPRLDRDVEDIVRLLAFSFSTAAPARPS